MSQVTITLSIPFDTLANTVKTLDYFDQQRLLALLEEEIAAVEEAIVDENDMLRREILEAQAAYDAGNYLTLDEYVAKQERID